jgi:hypothetical protein
MIYPPSIATLSPNPIYSSVIFQPNIEKSIAIAISLFIGAEIRNENVTPIGILADKNPKNRGIAEHVQNGVMIPNSEANILPVSGDLFARYSLTFSVEKYERRNDTAYMIVISKKNILILSYIKKFSALLKASSLDRPIISYVRVSTLCCHILA